MARRQSLIRCVVAAVTMSVVWTTAFVAPAVLAAGPVPVTYTYDASGRLSGVIDPSAGSAAYTYDSAGNVTAITRKAIGVATVLEVTPDRAAIGGQVTIEGTALYFYRARYYDPTFGRFISEDPLGLSAGDSNLYRYAGGDPTNAVDPSGRFLDAIIDVAFIAFDLWNLATGSRKDFDANLQALGLDVLGLVIPGVTGLGIATKLARQAGRAADVAQGVYVVVAKTAKLYVGQSSHITLRLAQHVVTRKISVAAARGAQRFEVIGGKTAREIAEQLKIDELGGKAVLENVVNPIGAARNGLLQTWKGADGDFGEYLRWLDYNLP